MSRCQRVRQRVLFPRRSFHGHTHHIVSTENDFPFIQQSVGFDTATKTFSSVIGSLWCEAATSRNQWFFIR